MTLDLAWHQIGLKNVSQDHLPTHPPTQNEITPDLAWCKFRPKFFSEDHAPTQNEITPDLALYKFGLKNFSWDYPPTHPKHLKKIPSTNSMLISILVLFNTLGGICPCDLICLNAQLFLKNFALCNRKALCEQISWHLVVHMCISFLIVNNIRVVMWTRFRETLWKMKAKSYVTFFKQQLWTTMAVS